VLRVPCFSFGAAFSSQRVPSVQIVNFVHVCTALGMASHISYKADMDANFPGFVISFALSRLTSILQQVEVVYFGGPKPERARMQMQVGDCSHKHRWCCTVLTFPTC